MNWQDDRTMSGRQFKTVIKQLGMTQAGAARFVGVAERTARRYITGEMRIPVAVALLLRAMVYYAEAPIVPPRKRGRGKA